MKQTKASVMTARAVRNAALKREYALLEVINKLESRLESGSVHSLAAARDLKVAREESHEHQLRVAHLEGYIERVQEVESIERGEKLSPRPAMIARLQDEIANGPEARAWKILNALDTDPELSDLATGRDPERDGG